MKLELESLIPLVLVAAFAATIYFNNSTPSISPNGFAVVKPTKDIQIIRGTDDIKEDDNKVKITHVDHPEDALNFRLWHDYILLPMGEDGKPIVPTRKNEDGTTSPLWKIDITRKEYIFDPGWDFGAYAGYLGGTKEGTRIKDFDVGLRVSPLRIWNTFAVDGLVSNQAAGLGISCYPAPARYGEFWDHVGFGYGRVISYDDDAQRNLFFFSLSTRF